MNVTFKLPIEWSEKEGLIGLEVKALYKGEEKVIGMVKSWSPTTGEITIVIDDRYTDLILQVK